MADSLRQFEEEIKEAFLGALIRAPVHLSGGNEEALIGIFSKIKPGDWVLSTHRSHYHALLKGVPAARVKEEICKGKSMHLNFPEWRFFTSAIVGGICPWAVGIAIGIKRRAGGERVWAFLGDMASQMGIFHECEKYARLHELPVSWVIEDNGMSTNTPTWQVWGYLDGSRPDWSPNMVYCRYERVYPHVGVGQWVDFGDKGRRNEDRADVLA